MEYGVNIGVGSGCPQQGFDFTGLPDRGATKAHWGNLAASHTGCRWIVPEDRTGFDQVPAAGLPAPV
ncbi:MAG TPA: hypothetical protein PKM73_09965 [Verrucomicrobiota bacterium]|nr:hypothetical protein [Verrucomicrobiota bacterium]HNU51684.1 hypothetical protein [Verrucomicrobiota bacterium]